MFFVNGMFIPIYEAIDRNLGGNDFIFGRHLPNRYKVYIGAWQHDLHRKLRDDKTMPTKYLKSIATSTTNGYHSLQGIVAKTHPKMMIEPYLQCAVYPYQHYGQNIEAFF